MPRRTDPTRRTQGPSSPEDHQWNVVIPDRYRRGRRHPPRAWGTAGLITGAPAIAQDTREMSIVSTWPRDFPGLGTSAQRLAARITELSEGRIRTEYFAAGERVGAFDSFDEVASGNAQAYIGADYYWTGKHPAWAYFTSVPFGMVASERNAWIKYGGGQELWDELAGEFGLKCLPCGLTGVQMGGWFNKEMESASDFKGLKMRIPGLGGDVLAKLGASTVSLPGGQIYENLVSGAIDATEWVGPYNDYFMKFYEAAKYYYYPGMHEPSSMLSFGMNGEFWGDLSEWEKAIITAACLEENANRPRRDQRQQRRLPAAHGRGERRGGARVLGRHLRELRGGRGRGVRGDARSQRARRQDRRRVPGRPALDRHLDVDRRRRLLAEAQQGARHRDLIGVAARAHATRRRVSAGRPPAGRHAERAAGERPDPPRAPPRRALSMTPRRAGRLPDRATR